MIHLTKSKFILAIICLHAGFCLGQDKITDVAAWIWGSSSATSFKKALKMKHPEKVTRIWIEIDSDAVFPSAELMRFKNLKYIRVMAKDSVGFGGELFGGHFQVNKITLRIDTNRLKCFTSLISLAFVGFDFSQFPKELCTLRHLKSLEMTGCNIHNLPGGISQMKSLEALQLRLNNLSSLPKEIENMDRLTIIDIGNNNFRKIPGEVLKMKNLAVLDMENTEANWEDTTELFPTRMNKINYAKDSVLPVLLKKATFLYLYISIYNKSIYSENGDERNFSRKKCKVKIMPDKALREKIEYNFDYEDD